MTVMPIDQVSGRDNIPMHHYKIRIIGNVKKISFSYISKKEKEDLHFSTKICSIFEKEEILKVKIVFFVKIHFRVQSYTNHFKVK